MCQFILTYKKKYLIICNLGKNLGGLKIPIKKKIFINPSLNGLNIDLDNYNKDHLSILFYESRKFTIEYDALQVLKIKIKP